MSTSHQFIDYIPIILLVILAFSTVGLLITISLYFKNKPRTMKDSRKSMSNIAPSNPMTFHSGSDNIQDYGINEILSRGQFTPAERAAEYRRRGKSPSGVIDGVYNDEYRGNEEYNDMYRDWDADA